VLPELNDIPLRPEICLHLGEDPLGVIIRVEISGHRVPDPTARDKNQKEEEKAAVEEGLTRIWRTLHIGKIAKGARKCNRPAG
jgi:hypothetical protein